MGWVFGSIGARALLAGLFLVYAAVSGCGAGQYADLSPQDGRNPELQGLIRSASVGSIEARLELGSRFEHGRGVSRDLGRAVQLYTEVLSGNCRDLAMAQVSPTGVQIVSSPAPTCAAKRIARERLTRLFRGEQLLSAVQQS